MLRIRELDILPHNRYLATDEKPSDEHRYRLTQVVHSYVSARVIYQFAVAAPRAWTISQSA